MQFNKNVIVLLRSCCDSLRGIQSVIASTVQVPPQLNSYVKFHVSFLCRVEIVKDGLRSKSKWWRKCPLEISHSSRQVLHSEPSFALFGEGSAAKEQWYIALKSASGQNSTIDSIKERYRVFSTSIRSNAQDQYPQVGHQSLDLSNNVDDKISTENDTRYYLSKLL